MRIRRVMAMFVVLSPGVHSPPLMENSKATCMPHMVNSTPPLMESEVLAFFLPLGRPKIANKEAGIKSAASAALPGRLR